MSKQLWFKHFEEELAENGWYDSHSDEAYASAAQKAWEKVKEVNEERKKDE